MSIFTNAITGSLLGNVIGTSSWAEYSTNATSGAFAISASHAVTASFVNTLFQPVNITGSFRVNNGSGFEFGVSDIGIVMGTVVTDQHSVTGSMRISGSLQVVNDMRVGNLSSDIHTVTGSLNVSNGVTASLFGTASHAVSASRAISASFVSSPYIYLNGVLNQAINNSSTIYSTNTRLQLNGLSTSYIRPSAGSFTVSATGVTPNVTGWYEIQCDVSTADGGGNPTLFSLGVGINGNQVSSMQLQTVGTSQWGQLSISCVGFVTAGQLIDFRAGSTAGELLTVSGVNVIVKYISA